MKLHNYSFWRPLSSFLVFYLIVTSSLLRGQTIYTGPDNGDWSTAANWSNGLPAIGNEPTVVGGTIVCINGALTLDYAVTNFGSIINKGTTTLSGSINSGGALANQGTFTINAGATMTSSGGFNNSGTLNNNGNVNSNSPLTNTTTGVFNNFATWSQNGAATNNGIMSNKAGTFSCPTLLTNNKTVDNLSGATWKIDFGGSFTNATGSTLSNIGQIQNLGTFTNNTTVTNSGTFTNNGIHTCTGIFNNENGGVLSSFATINLSGRINNKLGSSITSSFRFNILANGYVSNMAQFTNANMIDIALGGTYCNETLSTLTGQFGSAITNAGYFKIAASSTVTTNGSINNARKFDIYGTYDAMGGGQIINSDSLCNYGLVKNVNVINNSGIWKNIGTTENNSGGVWTNTSKIENNKGAVISNKYEIYNKPSATIVNNGTFNNGIRLFNEGIVTNNAYFVSEGDFLNKVSGSLINSEVLVVREGSIQNEGSISNQKTLINETCSIITNKAGATINNTGRFENRGIIFQRGTLTGIAVVQLNGYTQGAGSNAPSLCLTSLTTGTDALGEAKVYGQSGFKMGIGIDECAGFQYFANDVNRLVYTCPQIGQTLNTRFKILTRTGDSLTCTVPTTVFDNVAPVVGNCPKDATIYTTQNIATYSWPTVTGLDNCGDTPSVTSTNASGSSFPLGLTQVTVSVKDSRSNTTDCIFKVNVVKITTTATCPATDATAPVFGNCPANQTINSNTSSAVVVWNAPIVTDNCYPIVVQQNLNSGIAFPTGSNTVVYTAKDPTGNAGTCSFTVTVNSPADICTTDPFKPVIVNCPANFFGTVNAAINGAVGYWSAPTATDNCGAVSLAASAVSGSIFNVGTTSVIYTATDARNNTSTCSFTINVAGTNPCPGDVTGPVLTCPANVEVSTTNQTAPATWATPTATDACAPVILNGSHQSGNTFGMGTTTVTYTASDKVGNTSKCTFTVRLSNPCINDTQAPTLSTCPANQTLISSNGSTATAFWTAPTATDNCTLAGVTSNFALSSTFNLGTTNVVYTATDASGNTATCSFAITVNNNPCATDATPPVFANCPSNQSVTTTNNACKVVTWTAPTATDNCSTPSVTSTQNSGFCFPVGTTTVSYTATDAKGNKATCSFNVIVTNTDPCATDATPPVFANCPSNQSVTTTNNACKVVTWTAPTATDNCGTPSVTSTHNSGFCFPVGTIKVTYTATDAKSNKETCSFNVIVTNTDPCATDAIPPVFANCPANQSVTTTNNACKTVTWTAPTATDNFSTPLVASTQNSGFCFPVGTTTVSYTATDAKGNKAMCSFTVTVTNVTTCDAISTGKCYRIVNKLSGKVLGLEYLNTNNSTYINQYTYNDSPSLQWSFSKNSDGSYKIINQFSDNILACHYTSNGTRVYQWDNNNHNAKYWIIESKGNCEYRLKNEYSGKYLDNINSGSSNGGKIGISSASNNSDQLWRIEEVNCAQPCFNIGNIVIDRWYSMNWNFPIQIPSNNPNLTVYQGNTQGPSGIGDNYTDRVRGHISPQETGKYQFNVTGDDNVELFLSTSSMSADAARIAYIQGWTGKREYTKYSSQTSSTITLQANQYYYFELRHTERGGGDGWRISWKTPSNKNWQPIQSQFLARSCNTTNNATTTSVFEFNARADFKKVKLQWVSNSGLYNDYYIVEKADEKGEFSKIGLVNASTGNNISTVFDFVDAKIVEGDNYYRIKTVDFNGFEHLSSVKIINFKDIATANVFPNPVDDVLNIDLKSYEGRAVGISIYNGKGKLLSFKQIDKAPASPVQISTNDMPVGSYLVRLTPEGKREMTKQIIIAR